MSSEFSFLTLETVTCVQLHTKAFLLLGT